MKKNKTRNRRHCKNPHHSRPYMSIGNNSISVTRLEYCNIKISEGLSGFKIVLISDLHNREFGKGQYRLIDLVKEEQPDIITVTGDLIDRRRTDIDTAIDFIRKAVNIAPVYYVNGNHEIKSKRYNELYSRLKSSDVIVMDNVSIRIGSNGELRLTGLEDASSFSFDPNTVDVYVKVKIKNTLKSLINNGGSSLNVLLTHRPELIDIYSKCGADLVLSGHSHGGQVRLPLTGGLYAPGQGIFPRYTSGMYAYGNTSLVVSRGLGNSLFPLRIFNPPEVVVITLRSKQP